MTITVEYVEKSRHPEWPKVPDLVTIVVRYPRFIHSEMMTHRVFSRNASSSRAIPTAKLLKAIRQDMAEPVEWGSNKPGMQAGAELSPLRKAAARFIWRSAGHFAVTFAGLMARLGAHKQIVNRIVEPWSHITVVYTGCDWQNFFDLRCHPTADPTMQMLAIRMKHSILTYPPETLDMRDWHTPMSLGGTDVERIAQSVASCARTSYLNHDGTDRNFGKDLELHDMLARMKHLSPFEHQAQAVPFDTAYKTGNLPLGWKQYRHEIERIDHA